MRFYAALVFSFLYAPLLILIAFSFNDGRFTVWEGFSIRWYSAAVADPQLGEALVNSLIIGCLSAILSTAIGTLAAYGIWRKTAPLLSASLYLSLVTPEIVTGVSLLALFQWIFRFLQLRLGMYTVIAAHVAFSIAYVAIVVSARLRGYDRSQEEAAMDLGATEWRAFLARYRSLSRSCDRSGRTVSVSRLVRRLRYNKFGRGSRFRNPSHGDLCDGTPWNQPRSQCGLRAHRGSIWRSDPYLAKAAARMNRRTFLLGVTATACSRDSRPRLNVYNWSTYIDPAMVRRFEQERGVRIRYTTYESNEEMLAKVITGNSGWDVVFPTHSRLEPMWRNGLIAPLDHQRLPSLGNLEDRFRKPEWDPLLRQGVPYMWNATGIVYNLQQKPPPQSWSDLWNPKLQGRMTMLDDPEDVIGVCLLKLGYPFSSNDSAQLQQAKAVAIRQKALLRAYLNADVRDQLVAGDVLAAELWSTTAAQAIHADEKTAVKLGFTYPKEGFPLYCDCAVVLRESRRYELAHDFLEFLLQPDVAASNAQAAETATTNAAARKLLAEDPVLYPSSEVMARGVWPPALPSNAQRYRDRLWTEIKSA